MLISLNSIELFYHIISSYLSRIATSSFFQSGRDITEEIIISSFNDNVPELGFFLAFKFYSNTKNLNAATLYGNICLTILSNAHKPISEKFATELIQQSMKFYRNANLFP